MALKLAGLDLWGFLNRPEYLLLLPAEFQWKHSLFYVLISTALLLLASLAYQWWKESPDYGKNTGPTVYPLVGSLPSFLMNKHRWMHWAKEQIEKTPTLTMRQVMPGGTISIETANPANVKHFVKTRFDNYPKDEDIAEIFGDLLGNGIFNVNGECWLMQRKAASYEFGAQSLRILLMECVEKEMEDRLCPILIDAANAGKQVDLEDLLLRFAFDNVCAMSFGVDPACLHESLPTVDFAEAFDEAALLCLGRFFSFSPVWKAMRFFNIGNERRIRECVKTIDNFAYGVIHNRRQELQSGAQGHRDLLSRFMRLLEEQNASPTGSPRSKARQQQHKESDNTALLKEQYSDSDVFLKDIVVSFLIAGREAPALVLCWFFWFLDQHPAAEQAVQEEIASILQARTRSKADAEHFVGGKADAEHFVGGRQGAKAEEETAQDWSSPPSFTWEELKNMNYLHAALFETLRLYHPVPFIPRVALEDDVLPDGTFVPKGARVGYYPMAMGRMKSIWGPDCMEFKPERWLKDGEFRPGSPYRFPAFHAGPRLCLGKDIAILHMKAMAAALIPCFKLKPVPGYVPECQVSITVRMKGGMPVLVQPRTPPAHCPSS